MSGSEPGHVTLVHKLVVMAVKAEDLRREALVLTNGEGADLTVELLASLEGQTEDDAAVAPVAWVEEIECRARLVVAGESPTESWEAIR